MHLTSIGNHIGLTILLHLIDGCAIDCITYLKIFILISFCCHSNFVLD